MSTLKQHWNSLSFLLFQIQEIKWTLKPILYSILNGAQAY